MLPSLFETKQNISIVALFASAISTLNTQLNDELPKQLALN